MAIQNFSRYVVSFIMIVCITTACKTYYKSKTISPHAGSGTTAVKIDSLQQGNRYYILRNGDEEFYIRNIQLSADQKTAECTLDSVSVYHRLHLSSGLNNKYRYKSRDPFSNGVINEVHFYIPKDKTADIGSYTLQLEKVTKIEILSHDKKRTTNSYVLGALAGTLGAIVVTTIIIAATKESCPFVAAYDGSEFSVQGEIFGGSVYPQLIRYDYLPLKMAPTAEGTLQLKITNELKERQYTDLARLWRISHAASTKVFVDEKGNLLSVSDPQLPVQALLNGKKDVLASLEKTNDYNLVNMDDTARSDARNEIIMKFKKPAAANKGKLVLTLKNSYFIDLLHGEMMKGLGNRYAAFTAKQKSRPAEELRNWIKEQQIPLDISVLTEKGWQNTTSLTTVGPLAFRETAIQVDLSGVTGNEVEVKLGSGFMFWEIDYAAMDFSADQNFTVEKIDAATAIDETGKNVLTDITKADGVFLDQPSIGNAATLTFKTQTAASAGSVQTYVLESKGYYEPIRDFKNKPDLKFMQQFRNPNAFPLYGLRLYKKIKEEALALN